MQAADDLAASAYWIHEITGNSSTMVWSVKGKLPTTQNEVTYFCQIHTPFLIFIIITDAPYLHWEECHEKNRSLNHEERINLIDVGTTSSIVSLLETPGNIAVTLARTFRHDKSFRNLPRRHLLLMTVASGQSPLLYMSSLVTEISCLACAGTEVSVLPVNVNDRL